MMFETYLKLWDLTPDGDPIETLTSNLLPVQSPDGPAMLKIGKTDNIDEQTEIVLHCYNGIGAVKLLAADGQTTLMERTNPQDLKSLALSGQDDQASEIIASTITKLHQYSGPLPDLPKIEDVFAPLMDSTDPRFKACANSAREMLAEPNRILLHRDIHHENILNSPRGWLAIDPKGVIGPPIYEFANSFHNPVPHIELLRDAGRMQRMADIFANNSSHSAKNLLRAAHAHAAISTIWYENDGGSSDYMLKNAEILGTLI